MMNKLGAYSRGFVYRTAGALCLCALFGLLLIIPSVSSETDNAANTPLYSHWYGSGLDGSDVLLEDLLEEEDASNSAADFNVGSFSLHRPQSELFINGLIGGLYDTAAAAAADGDAVENYLQARARAQLTDEAVPDFKTWLLGDGQGIGDRLLVGSADYVTDYLTAAATDSASGLRFVRTVEWDYQSALGERRWQTGLSALGALREGADDAIVWQLRGYAAEESAAGANAGLIYRRVAGAAEAADTALLGVNVFLDYEKHGDYDEDFLRWSLGGEYRNAYLDVYLNRYFPITDGIRQRNGNYVYTQGGQEAYLNVKAPDFAFGRVSGGLTYYLWEGEYGDADDKGFRYHIGFAPQQGNLKLELELDSPDSGSTDWGGRISYRHIIGAADKGTVAAAADAAFDARAHFFDAVRREYAQRIRESGDGDGAPDTQAPTVMEFRVLEGSGTAGETAAQLNVLQLDPAADSEAATIVLQAPAAGAAGAVQTITLSAQTVSITIAANSSLALSASRWQATLRAESAVRLVASGSRLEVVGGGVAFSRSGNGLNTILLDDKTTIALLGTQGEVGINEDSAIYETFIRLMEGSVALTVNDPAAISVALVGLSATAVVDLTPEFFNDQSAGTVQLTLGCATARQRDEHRRLQPDYSGCEDDVYVEGLGVHGVARLQTPQGMLTLRGDSGGRIVTIVRDNGNRVVSSTIVPDRVSVLNAVSDSYTLTAAWERFPFHPQAATLRVFTSAVALSRESATVSISAGSSVAFTATVTATADNGATVTATVVDVLVQRGRVAGIGPGQAAIDCGDDTSGLLVAAEGEINVIKNCDDGDAEDDPATPAGPQLVVRAVGVADAGGSRSTLDVLVEGALTIKSRINVGQTITLSVRGGGGDIRLEDSDTVLSLVSGADGVAVLSLTAAAAPQTENYTLHIDSANGEAAITREVVVEIIDGNFAIIGDDSFHTATEVYGGGFAVHTVSVANAIGRAEYTEAEQTGRYNNNFVVDKYSGIISIPNAVRGSLNAALRTEAGEQTTYRIMARDIYEYDRRLDFPAPGEVPRVREYRRWISPPGAVITLIHPAVEDGGQPRDAKNIGSFSSLEGNYARAYERATNYIYLHAVGNAGIDSHDSTSVTLSGVSVDASGVIGKYSYAFFASVNAEGETVTISRPGFELVTLDSADGPSVAIRMTDNCEQVTSGGTGNGGDVGCHPDNNEGSAYPPTMAGGQIVGYDMTVWIRDEHPDSADLLVNANVAVYPSIHLVLSNDEGIPVDADGTGVGAASQWVSSGQLARAVAREAMNTELARLHRVSGRAAVRNITISIGVVNPPSASTHFSFAVDTAGNSANRSEGGGALIYNYDANAAFDGGVVSVVLFAEHRTASGKSDLPGGRVAYTLEVTLTAPLAEFEARDAPTVLIDAAAVDTLILDFTALHFGQDFVNTGNSPLAFAAESVSGSFAFSDGTVLPLDASDFRVITGVDVDTRVALSPLNDKSTSASGQPAGAVLFSESFANRVRGKAIRAGDKATLMIKVSDGSTDVDSNLVAATYALPLEMIGSGDINISFAGEEAPTVTILYKQTGALLTVAAAVASRVDPGGTIRYGLVAGLFTDQEDPDQTDGEISGRLVDRNIGIDSETGMLSITLALINEYARDDNNCQPDSRDGSLRAGCPEANVATVNLAGFALPRFSVTAALVEGVATPTPVALPVVITVLPVITLEALPTAAIDKIVTTGTDLAGVALYTVLATTVVENAAPDLTFSYAIIGGNASAMVSLDRDSGVLSIADGVNRAHTLTLTIAATDTQFSDNALTTEITVGWRWFDSVFPEGNMYIIGGRAIDENDVDGDGNRTETLASGEVWSSGDGEEWTLLSNTLPPRHRHAAAVLGGTIFVQGGLSTEADGTEVELDDLWASADGGRTWRELTYVFNDAGTRGEAREKTRRDHSMLSHRGRLYIIGGEIGGTGTPETNAAQLVSDDGESWYGRSPRDSRFSRGAPVQTINGMPTVVNRQGYVLNYHADGFAAAAVVAHEERVWTIGGHVHEGSSRGFHRNRGIYRSRFPGSNRGRIYFDWQSISTDRNRNPIRRNYAQALSYNGRIYLIGGSPVDDTDGSIPDMPAGCEPDIISANRGTVCTGGGDPWTDGAADVWSFADGDDSWRLETKETDPMTGEAAAPFGKLLQHNAFVKGVSMYVVAGRTDSDPDAEGYALKNDVWASVDGINWNLVTDSPGFSARYGAAVVVFTPPGTVFPSDDTSAAPAAVEDAPSPQPQEDAPPLAIHSAFPIIRDDSPAVAFLDAARRLVLM